jgi:hypothetical protein
MTWLIWRQHRAQMALMLGLLAVFAVPVVITGRNLADAFNACQNNSCGDLFMHYDAIMTTVNLTVAAPLIFGIFWGVSVIGRELETGTATLAWSQSVARRHWVRVKLLWLFGTTLAASSALAGLVTWWSNPRNALQESRFAGLPFDLEGLSPVGFSLFSAALGLAAGVAWRRVLPAVATTIAGYVGVRMIVELVFRPHYMSPVQRLVSMTAPPEGPRGSWAQGNELVHNGRVLGSGVVNLPAACARSSGPADVNQCMDAQGFRVRVTYQPAGRYWTFQWIEFGIFAALSVLLVGVALVLLRRRDV